MQSRGPDSMRVRVAPPPGQPAPDGNTALTGIGV